MKGCCELLQGLGVGLWNSDLDVGVQRGAGVRSLRVGASGRDSRLRRVDWQIKKTMQFLRSAAWPLASLLENTSEFPSWLTPFFRLSRSQNKGKSFRPTDIPRRRYPASMVWGRFVMASVDATGGTLIGKTCPRKAILWRYCGAGIKGEALAWFRKRIWPTLGK
jgi:hypothetical protein